MRKSPAESRFFSGDATAIAWADGGEPVIAAAEYGQGRVVALGDATLWSWVEFFEEKGFNLIFSFI